MSIFQQNLLIINESPYCSIIMLPTGKNPHFLVLKCIKVLYGGLIVRVLPKNYLLLIWNKTELKNDGFVSLE